MCTGRRSRPASVMMWRNTASWNVVYSSNAGTPPARYLSYSAAAAWRGGSSNEQRPEIRRFELHRDAAALLAVLDRPRHEREVVVERRRQRRCRRRSRRRCRGRACSARSARRLSELPLVALQHLRLQRHVDRLVAVARRERGVVERKHEAVDEEHPLEARGIEVVSHRDAVGGRRLDADAVEDVVEVLRAWLCLLQRGFLVDQPLRVRAFRVGEREPEERARRGDRLGVVVAQAQRRAAGRRRCGVDVRIVWKRRMRVVIEHLDAVRSAAAAAGRSRPPPARRADATGRTDATRREPARGRWTANRMAFGPSKLGPYSFFSRGLGNGLRGSISSRMAAW